MSDPCTYGNVPLFYPSAAVLDSVNAALSQWSHPEVNQWQTPPRLTMPRALEVGCLFWPWGASRHAVGLFLATDNQLARIRPQVYGSSGNQWNALPFVMNDQRTGHSITTNLFMLPPRPLDQIPGLNGLSTLLLVDDRYRWWEKAATITVVRNVTTWTQLIAQFSTALGVTITPDTVASAYLNPDATLAGFDVDLPPLLDRALASCGQRLVRLLNGTVITQNPRTAKKSQDTQLNAYTRDRGGKYLLVPAKPTDLQAHVPAQVAVTFPIIRGGTFAQVVTLVSLGLPEYAGITGHSGTKLLHSLAAFGGTNSAELTAMAKQIAQDWYLWQLGRQESKFQGIDPYTPEGINDHIKWESSSEGCNTWVRRAKTPDPGTLGQASTAGAQVDVTNWWFIGPGPTGSPVLTGVLPILDFGGIETQGGLDTSALSPPAVTTITLTTTGTTVYSFTVIGTSTPGFTTAPGSLLTVTTGPNSPPSVGSPITVAITTTPGVTSYTIFQTTPTPGVVALVTYDPTTVTVTATTGTGTTITGATVTPGAVPVLNIPIVSVPNQSLALPFPVDETNQVVTGLLTSSGVLVPQLPTPPAPTTTSTPAAGATNVSYTVVLCTPAGTFTPASPALALTSIQTPSVANPVNLQVDLSSIPIAILVGTAAILYRPTNTGGLATGPIQVSPVAPGATVATFTDTGQGLIPNLSTTAPGSNTTGTISAGGPITGINVVTQATPGAPTVTPVGTTGATTYSYKITALDGTGETVASAAGTTTTGNATLSSTNLNAITWNPIATAPQSYNVYRTAGGAAQGKIGSVLAGQPLVFLDTGIAAGAAAPSVNTTGELQLGGTNLSLPVTVANGGTGNASFTVDAVVCGGATGTGALQTVSGLGTTGQILTSNGPGALPTWQAGAGGATASDKTDNTGTATSSTTYVDLGTLSFTSLASGTYVFFGRVLASWSPGGSGLTASAKITDGTTTIDESDPFYGIDFTPSGGTTYGTVTLFGRYVASGSPTVKIQVHVGGSTTITFTGKLSYIKIA